MQATVKWVQPLLGPHLYSILEVMSKEMGVIMTTAAQSTSTTASDARTSWGVTSITDEAARVPRCGGHALSTSRAELANPDKADKELLVSTFSAAVWVALQ